VGKIEEEVMMSDDVTQSTITGLISIAIAAYISRKSVVCRPLSVGSTMFYKSFAVFGEVDKAGAAAMRPENR
jgi:hypothetical protein